MHADVVLAGSLQEEEEGVTANVEARVIHIQQGGGSAGQCARRFRISSATWPAAWAAASTFPFREPREIFDELRDGVARRHRRLLRHHLREASTSEMGVFWPCPIAGASRHAAAVRRRPLLPPRWQGALHEAGVARERRSGGRGISHLPHHRPRGQPVSFRHADAAHRRAGGSVSRSRSWSCIRAWRSSTAFAPGIGSRSPRGAAPSRCRRWWCAPSGPTRSSFPTTGRAGAAPTA